MDDGDVSALSSLDAASTGSLYMRELEALNGENNTLAFSGTVETEKKSLTGSQNISAGGDTSDSKTLSQAMKPVVISDIPQIIDFSENEDQSTVTVLSQSVTIQGASSDKLSASNKVKITPIVNHVWDLKYFSGNLVAVHKDNDFAAYVLRGKCGGNVRVMIRKTADRCLLKSFTGDVKDLAFALSDDVYLAAIDEAGDTFVYSFERREGSLLHQLVLHIKKNPQVINPEFQHFARIIWCPYMPEEEADNGDLDPAKMIVVLYGTQAEVWNVDYVSNHYGVGPVSTSSVNIGVMAIDAYESDLIVVNAAFAPDGSAIAVAYVSGPVKFYLVDLESQEPDTECMYDWNPHDGLPVTCMYFLDDHKHPVTDLQLWKFALTGARFNTEIKIWCCESWTCTQTINFLNPIPQPILQFQLKSNMDITSKFLALSDFNSKVLYIFQVHQDYKQSVAHISSVSCFPLAHPCVSCFIYEAGTKKFKHTADDSYLDEITTGEIGHQIDNRGDDGTMDEDDEDNDESPDGGNTGVQLQMYGVHTRHLQDMLIRFRPNTNAKTLFVYSNLVDAETQPENNQELVSNDKDGIYLLDENHVLTPAAFSSPSVPKLGNNVDAENLSPSSTSTLTRVSALNDERNFDSPSSSVDPSSYLTPSTSYMQSPSKSSPNGTSYLSEIPLPGLASGEENESFVNAIEVGSKPGDDSRVSNKSNQEIIDEFFTNSQQGPVSGLGNSIETASSTGSFPVANSLQNSYHEEEKYDENDKEVAEALGETEEEEAEDDDDIKNDEVKTEVVWPDPPDVSSEAKRLADEVIERIENEDVLNKGEDEDFEDEDDDENDEAEIEEIIQSIDERDDDVEEAESNQPPSDYPERPHRPEPGQVPSHYLSKLDSSLASITRQFQQQQEMMEQMKAELDQQRELQLQLHRQQLEQQQLYQVTTQQPSLEKDISKLEDILVSRMEHSLAQHMHKETQRLQDSLRKSDAERKHRDSNLHNSLVTEVTRQVKDTMSSGLRTEIKQTVSPALHRFIEPMKEKMHQEVAQRLSTCDQLLKDNISKAVKSRSTMDVLASSIGDVIYQQMQQAYSDTFKTVLLPSFKASMEKTVRDVHAIFQQGSKEYQLYMRQNMDFVVKEGTKTEEIVKRIESAQMEFVSSVEKVKSHIITSVREELDGNVAQSFSRYREDLLKDVQKVVKEEITSALKEHGANINDKLNNYLRSGAGTPVHMPAEEDNTKEIVQRELRSGRLNEAFQTALTASNLDLVVYVCEQALPLNIFQQTPCPLTQPVLLSLISQLSANLEKHFDLKVKYLEDAVMNLDPEAQMTAEHIPRVLGSLVARLKTCESHANDARRTKNKKMLIMAANSLLS